MDKKEEKKDSNFRYFIRIANTDLDGKKTIVVALSNIKGIGLRLSQMMCNLAKIDTSTKAGKLNDEQVKKLSDIVENPVKYKIPTWAFNRRKDYDDGTDKHIITSDLMFAKENDIKTQRKIKSYVGTRHSSGLPSRGQRTKSNFRKNKGKVSLGVKKKGAK